MKKLLFALFMFALPLAGNAQTPQKFGYFSYQTALASMPDYAIATRKLADLKLKYEEEMRRVEEEFNKKFEQFLEGQRDFAPSILRKRQAELKDMIEKNLAFKEESNRLLKQAETEIYAPLKKKLADAIRGIGDARGFMFIVNTDNETLPYVNGTVGEDINALLKESLQ